jgi:predicted metal-dependent peptidase
MFWEELMNKIQQAIAALTHTEPFYGHLICKMRISKSDKVPSAGVYITDKINLVYNEEWIESLELFDVVKVLKHECEHILREHIYRAKQIGATSKELHKRFNLATDATINVNDLLPTVKKIGGVTVEKLNESLKQMVDEANAKDKGKRKFEPMIEGQIAEYYYNRINEFAEENGDILPDGDSFDDHSIWEESEGNEEMQKEVAKSAINESVKDCGGIGNVPGEVASLVSELNKNQVNWKQQLRQFYVATLKSSKLATRKKRNRRYGIIQPGVKKKPELHLGLCVDTSGSVSDAELQMFWAEMQAINSCGVKITIIEADCSVQNVYEFDSKKTPTFKGRGGTAYNPAIQKAVELKVDGILYCGDFDTADTPENPKKPFLWVGVRKSPPPAEFGKVIYLEEVK